MFHDSVAAALEWSTRDPAVGLRLLRLLARAWHGSGRPQAAMTAVDLLLTDENAERFPVPGLPPQPRWPSWSAPLGAGPSAHGLCDAAGLSPTKPATTTSSRSATCCSATRRTTASVVRRLAHERGERYVECIATMAQASVAVEADPSVASAMLEDADFRAAAARAGTSRLRRPDRGRAALYLGDLERCIEFARGLLLQPVAADDRVRETLGRRRAARSRRVGRRGGSRCSRASASPRFRARRPPADVVIHQRSLLAGGPARVDPDICPRTSIPAIRRRPTS